MHRQALMDAVLLLSLGTQDEMTGKILKETAGAASEDQA